MRCKNASAEENFLLLHVFLSTQEFVRLSFCLQHQKIARNKIGYLGVKLCDWFTRLFIIYLFSLEWGWATGKNELLV